MNAHPTDLDAFVMGELPGSQRAAVANHVQTCASCAEELRMLMGEQLRFSQRRNSRPVPPAEFASVAADLRRRSTVLAPFYAMAGAATAAALLLLVLGRVPAAAVSPSDVGGMCGASWLAGGWCELPLDSVEPSAATSEEDLAAACLMRAPA